MKQILALLGALLLSGVHAQELRYSDDEVINSYQYLLARLLVLRQEHVDFKLNGYKWNELFHQKPGKGNVVSSTGWMGLDKKSCAILEIPELKERYFSVQVFNGWGETVHHISKKNYTDSYAGKFAYCLPKTKMEEDSINQKVILPYEKLFVKILIEKIDEEKVDFRKVQRGFKLSSLGKPRMSKSHPLGNFKKHRLPGLKVIQKAQGLIKSEKDINPNVEKINSTLIKISNISQEPGEQKPIDLIIQKWGVPAFLKLTKSSEESSSFWVRLGEMKNVPPFLNRALRNYSYIWLNEEEEFYYKTSKDSDGHALSENELYTMTFAPQDIALSGAWSLDLNQSESVLSHQMSLSHNMDGSLTLYFSAYKPLGVRNANWVSLKKHKSPELTLKLFGPTNITQRENFPPPLVKARHRITKQ